LYYWKGRLLEKGDRSTKCSRQLAYQAIEELLLKTDNVLVINEFSKSKSKLDKGYALRDILKIVDDAHFKKIKPASDIVIIDYANFLQRSWTELSVYIRIISPN
jgi:hypothetical protein